MGLDISHIKATLVRPTTTDPYRLGEMTEESFDSFGFDVPFTHFEKYIQKIDCANILTTAILVKNESDLKYTKEWFEKYDYPIFFEKTQASLEKTLRKYESKHNLSQLHTHINTMPQRWNVLYHYEIIKKIGFYETDEGYQRGGMNSDFAPFYQRDKYNFVLQEEFEKAYNCIDDDLDFTTEAQLMFTKKNFKENFLDKFEYGASYLSLSW